MASEPTRPRRATIAEVAKAAGVSASTVDRVLNGRAPVRTDTAQRIHEAAQAVGFHAAGVIRERVRGRGKRYRLGFLLEQPESAFYRELTPALQRAVALNEDCEPPVIEYMDEISPEAVCRYLARMGEKVDAIAVVAADHALIGAEIERLKERGVPVFALISDLSTPARAGYVGLDNRRVGRTAAWFITRLAREPGKLAVFLGSHRFQCQELAEMSFRSYIREHAPQFELLEPMGTLESNAMAEESARNLLQRHPDIVGLFVAGGGIEGILRALLELDDGGGAARPIGIAREFTQVTRDGLLNGRLDAVLSHPLPRLSRSVVAAMLGALAQPAMGQQQVVVPLDTQTPQSA